MVLFLCWTEENGATLFHLIKTYLQLDVFNPLPLKGRENFVALAEDSF
jgi:hypothetical protein